MKIKRKILMQMADPAGNKTAFVLSGARQSDYQSIAKYILEQTDFGAEQVAFVKSGNAIDMSGMEFCGNAARAFALMTAKGMIDGKCAEETTSAVYVTVSSLDTPVTCVVNTEHNYTKCFMPLPKRIKKLIHCGFASAEGSTAVVMDGIVHIIIENIEYTEENYQMIKQAAMDQFDPPALGVLYLNTETLEMTPVVYVKDIDKEYVEGSCGSGSTAVAAFLSQDHTDGEYVYDLKQPAGTIRATAVMKDDKLANILIEGPVDISDPVLIEAEYESDEDELSSMMNTW